MARRWEVTPEELARIHRARDHPLTVREVVSLLARRPSLVPEVGRDVIAHAVAGVWQSSALVWLLDSERLRREVPDAARGVGFADERPFLEALLPVLQPHHRVLDVGGGDGRISRHVAPLVREVVVSDPSATMVGEALENLGALGNVTTHHADGFTLEPLADASFDVAFAQGVLSYIDVNQGLALLDEIARTTAPGGVAVLNAFTIARPEWAHEQVAAARAAARRRRFASGTYRAYAEAQLEAMVSAVGFEIERTGYFGDVEARRLPYVVVARRPR
jgi:SAM-dependent methyltransferase